MVSTNKLYLLMINTFDMFVHSTKLVPIKKKEERQLLGREEKALRAAKVDNVIEEQLLNRLKIGTVSPYYSLLSEIDGA